MLSTCWPSAKPQVKLAVCTPNPATENLMSNKQSLTFEALEVQPLSLCHILLDDGLIPRFAEATRDRMAMQLVGCMAVPMMVDLQAAIVISNMMVIRGVGGSRNLCHLCKQIFLGILFN